MGSGSSLGHARASRAAPNACSAGGQRAAPKLAAVDHLAIAKTKSQASARPGANAAARLDA
jgi:hypothetical protein